MNHLTPKGWQKRARNLAEKLKAERLLTKEMECRWKEERSQKRKLAEQILDIRDLVCHALGMQAPPLFADDVALVKKLIAN